MTGVQIAQELVGFQSDHVLKNISSRKKLARELCEVLNFWSVEEMSYFVEEMRGLNFASLNDRNLFLQFLFQWLNLEAVA